MDRTSSSKTDTTRTSNSSSRGSVVRRPSRLSAARSVFEQTIERNAEHGMDSGILQTSAGKRRVQAKSRRQQQGITFPENTARMAPRATSCPQQSQTPKQVPVVPGIIRSSSSPDSTPQAASRLASFIEDDDELINAIIEDENEDGEASVSLTEAETDDQSPTSNRQSTTRSNHSQGTASIESHDELHDKGNEQQSSELSSRASMAQHLQEPTKSSELSESATEAVANVNSQNLPPPPPPSAGTGSAETIPARAVAQSSLIPSATPQATPATAATAARKIQRVSRQFSNKNRIRRDRQAQELQKLLDRRELEVERLERVRNRDDIESSVKKFERVLEKNEEFGFSCRNLKHEMPYQKLQQKKFLQTEQRRQRKIDAAPVKDELSDYDVMDEDDLMDLPSEAAFDGEVSLKMEQLQALHDNRKQETSHGITVPKAGRKLLRRTLTEDSGESTLSPIKDDNNNEVDNDAGDKNDPDDSLVDFDKPVPNEIVCDVTVCFDDSQITFNSRIFDYSEDGGSRWESHAVYHKSDEYTPPIHFNPTPATMKQGEGSRWAVHPRVVYGTPKTKKAVNIDRFRSPLEMNLPAEEIENRWAASTTRKKKLFPKNASRWAAQLKHGSTGGEIEPAQAHLAGAARARLPHNKPRRQKTNETSEGAAPGPKKPKRVNSNPAKSAPAPRLPQRKRTSEGEDFPLKHKNSTLHHIAESDTPPSDRKPRRGRRRRSISGDSFGPAEAKAMANSMPTVERDLDEHIEADNKSMGNNSLGNKSQDDSMMIKTTTTTRHNHIARVSRKGRLSRNKSLGEVKRIHAAVRVQSLIRKYLQQYHFKISLQQSRKDDLKTSLTVDILTIRGSLEARKQSLREKMELEHSLGVAATDDDDGDSNISTEDAATVLRREIADMEDINRKLRKQCDRLRSTNQRMVGGNRTRENAVKDVSARLKKLQLIQTKLDRVHKEFQKEHTIVLKELHGIEYSIERELALGTKTKACMQEIVALVRNKDEAELAAEAEAMIQQ